MRWFFALFTILCLFIVHAEAGGRHRHRHHHRRPPAVQPQPPCPEEPPPPPTEEPPGEEEPPEEEPPGEEPPPVVSEWPVGLTWQWQLTGNVNTSVNAQVYDIDGEDASADLVAQLHSQGRRVICYISAGTWEDWRNDAGDFPSSVLGNGNGWPGERWLDIRQIDVLLPIMAARMDMCKAKGFDAVEPDNIDGYSNNTGFNLNGAHQLAYNLALAQAAHDRGLAIGFKNNVEQAAQSAPFFDFAINEECFQWNECGTLVAFIEAGKAVFHAEYNLDLDEFCSEANDMGFSSILKDENLGASRQTCEGF